ncbi:MAG: hypothetical protein DMF56_27735 [Acidobacteria bacterium]|nr:MAG: hypothetical protein DMF56_27735 [Acidobacteriota bacterium]
MLLKSTPTILKTGLKVRDKLTTTNLEVDQTTHHELLRNFLSHDLNPQVMYGVARTGEGETLQAATAYLASRMTPPVHMHTNDGWQIVSAARRPPTFREQLRISSPPDLLPYGVMFLVSSHGSGCHVFVGCRYTEPYQINFANRFGAAAAKNAYEAIIAVPIQAPLTQVTSANLDQMP